MLTDTVSGDGVTTCTYTATNLLSTVAHTGVGTSSMTWDAAGNRVKFTSSSDTNNPYYFVYDVTAGIPATVEENHDNTSTYYIREPGGALIARTWYSGGVWQYQYYHFDDMGSTLLLTNGDGAITDSYAYDAWGKSTHTGSTNQPYQYIGRLGYYSHYQDSNMGGLLQLGVRFYDPSLGRFTQRDPIKEISNSRYVYVRNNPISGVDASGKSPLDTLRYTACTVGCKISYDAAIVACALYTESKSACIATALIIYTACVAGCKEALDACEPEKWSLYSLSEPYCPIQRPGETCRDSYWTSNKGRRAKCFDCWWRDKQTGYYHYTLYAACYYY